MGRAKKPSRLSSGSRSGKTSAGAPTRGDAASGRVSPDRRAFLGNAKIWSIAAVVTASVGWLVVDQVNAHQDSADISVLGDGVPTIVQIHDPTCPMCRELQREAQRAMGIFGDDQLRLLTVNIRTSDGASFARAHGVGHVTLLFFNGVGEVTSTLQGVHRSDVLRDLFEAQVLAERRS